MADPRSFSQLYTSFVASISLGIPRTPLHTFLCPLLKHHCSRNAARYINTAPLSHSFPSHPCQRTVIRNLSFLRPSELSPSRVPPAGIVAMRSGGELPRIIGKKYCSGFLKSPSLRRRSSDRTTQSRLCETRLQKGGVPAAPSGTATLLRLSPSYQFCPRTLLAVTYFRHPRLPWLDGRCVQGPGTYSPRHG